MRLLPNLVLFCATLCAAGRPLLVISIDGMDHRYLKDRDQLGLKIPNLRRLISHGQWADGVVGVVPTVTFPSHTTMVTGVRPDRHGILNNNRPQADGGERYFSASHLKVTTLWDAARRAGLKTAAVHWPVTVDARIDFNIPEHFKKRLGDGMDFASTAEKTTPGLMKRILATYPSIGREWLNDYGRALATIHILRNEKPDFVLLHLIDHDNEAHENGPFTQQANASLEYIDELLGRILASTPKNMVVAIVSDHGFERADTVINVTAMLRKAGIAGKVQAGSTMLTTADETVAAYLRKANIGREIPAEEWKRFLPNRPVPLAAFEPNPHGQFASAEDAPESVARMHGDHGYWPTRAGFRSSFLLSGPGITQQSIPEIDMLTIAGRFAEILGFPFGKE